MKIMIAITMLLGSVAFAARSDMGSSKLGDISLLQDENPNNCFSTHYCTNLDINGAADFCCCQFTLLNVTSNTCQATAGCELIPDGVCGSSTLQISSILVAVIGAVSAHFAL